MMLVVLFHSNTVHMAWLINVYALIMDIVGVQHQCIRLGTTLHMGSYLGRPVIRIVYPVTKVSYNEKISVQVKSKQPKGFKNFKFFLFNFRTNWIKMNSDKKFF